MSLKPWIRFVPVLVLASCNVRKDDTHIGGKPEMLTLPNGPGLGMNGPGLGMNGPALGQPYPTFGAKQAAIGLAYLTFDGATTLDGTPLQSLGLFQGELRGT